MVNTSFNNKQNFIASKLGPDDFWCSIKEDIKQKEKYTEIERKINLFLQKGYSINLRHKENSRTLLMVAVKYKYSKVVKLLLDKGADVNAKNKKSDSALSIAEERKYHYIMKLLKQKNNRIVQSKSSTSTGSSPATRIQQSQLNNNKESLYKSWSYFKNIVESQDTKNLEKFLNQGFDVNLIYTNLPNRDSLTPLMFVCEHGNIDMVKLLLNKGADTNIINISNGKTVLEYAKCADKRDIVRFLLGMKVEVKMHDGKGNSILTWASKKGYEEIVRMLLDCEPDINILDEFGDSALNLAIKNNHINVVKVLLNANADFFIKNKNGHDALSIAKENKNPEIIALLSDSINSRSTINSLKSTISSDQSELEPVIYNRRSRKRPIASTSIENNQKVAKRNKSA